MNIQDLDKQGKTNSENFMKLCREYHSKNLNENKDAYRAYEKSRREEGLVILLETILYVAFIMLACVALVFNLFPR